MRLCFLWLSLFAALAVHAQAPPSAPVFVKVSYNKPTCYLGEPILVEYTVYTKGSIDVHIKIDPFFSDATQLPTDRVDTAGTRSVTLDGRPYEARVIFRQWLLPLVQGQLKTTPIVVAYKKPAPLAQGSGLQDLMDQTDKKAAGKDTTASGAAPRLDVLPLPPPPAGSSGAVGTFTLTLGNLPTQVVTGRLYHIQVLLHGAGSLLPGQRPAVRWPAGITPYDIKDTDRSVLPSALARLTDFAFVDSLPGRQTIPPITFTYFDPAARAYKTLQTDPIVLEVGAGAPPPPAGSSPARPFPYIWVFAAAVLLLVLALWWGRKRRAPVPAQPTVAPVLTGSYKNEPMRAGTMPPPTTAPSAAPVPKIPTPAPADPFFWSAGHLAAAQYDAFYKSLQDELWIAIGGKGPYPGSIPAKAYLESRLDADRLADAMALFSVCAVSLYTPVHLSEEARVYLTRARALAP